MALLDTDRDLIVIRIVYDGPALSGKTTTLRALAGSLGREVFSGDEAEGRTLYFDWLDYTGGRFEGYPIRCQVVSVPGQRLLGPRRRHLLTAADAVVFVADTRQSALESSARGLETLRLELQDAAAPRPGVVVQANKRDAPDAAPLVEVRAALASNGSLALMESVACGGAGVREAFVLSVRLALDRVRELMRCTALPKGRAEIDSGAALLEQMRAREQSSDVPSGAALGLRQALASEASSSSPTPAERRTPPAAPRGRGETQRDVAWRERPRLPAADIPGGMIWPPIEGRIVLHQALAEESRAPQPERLPDGSWTAVFGGRWRAHSYERHVFVDADSSRAALIDWARWHGGCHGRLSPGRCILAAEAFAGHWRLWQVVRGERTLRAALERALSPGPPQAIARGLLDLAGALSEGVAACAPLGLHCSLDTLGFGNSGPVFVGLAPGSDRLLPTTPGQEVLLEERLRADFGRLLRESAGSGAFDVPRVIEQLAVLAAPTGQTRLAETLTAVLIGH